jgi:hypothetical protein
LHAIERVEIGLGATRVPCRPCRDTENRIVGAVVEAFAEGAVEVDLSLFAGA